MRSSANSESSRRQHRAHQSNTPVRPPIARSPLTTLTAAVFLTFFAALLTSCAEASPDDSGTVCPPDSHLTWENFGEPFLLTWCTSCHSSHLSGEGDPNERQNAPHGSDFDTYAHYLDWAEDVDDRAGGSNTSMPPAGGPTEFERAMLSEWIACGSPR